MDKEWIHLVQVGDVPGRLEPGTGELNYSNIYRVLREKKYAGIVDSVRADRPAPRIDWLNASWPIFAPTGRNTAAR